MTRQSLHDVFVCYASKDEASARMIHEALSGAGVRSWFAPADIQIGIRFGEALFEAIEGAEVLLLVFSPEANQSNMVDREVGLAGGMGIPILPVRISSGEPSKSLRFFIGTHNWFDASTGALEDRLPKLVQSVEVLLKHTAPATGEQAEAMVRNLVVFSTTTQITELWTSRRGLELYLYDIEDGAAQRRWTLPPGKLSGILEKGQIEAQPTSKYEDCGLFAIGAYRWWLYSKVLHPSPERLRAELTSLASAALRWGEAE